MIPEQVFHFRVEEKKKHCIIILIMMAFTTGAVKFSQVFVKDILLNFLLDVRKKSNYVCIVSCIVVIVAIFLLSRYKLLDLIVLEW